MSTYLSQSIGNEGAEASALLLHGFRGWGRKVSPSLLHLSAHTVGAGF